MTQDRACLFGDVVNGDVFVNDAGIEELGDEVIARFNPTTGEIENLEILFFSTRLLRSDLLELPVTADLRRAV